MSERRAALRQLFTDLLDGKELWWHDFSPYMPESEARTLVNDAQDLRRAQALVRFWAGETHELWRKADERLRSEPS